MSTNNHLAPGRPPATSHSAIEAAAFALFTQQGFDETTTDGIAAAAGISRRTLFRYFPSKYDIPWGQFDESLDRFRCTLESMPTDQPLWVAVQRGVVVFNSFAPEAITQHRTRMLLILQTPSLQAHSVLRYGRWRTVIAEYAAQRTGQSPTDLLPRTVGHVSLALAVSAYEQWLSIDSAPLEPLLADAMAALRSYVCDAG